MSNSPKRRHPIYPHQAERLTEALERGSLDALLATSPENVAYLTGFRSFTGAMFPAPAFGVFTRQGTALVVPAVDAPAAVADPADVDHVVSYGEFSASFAQSAGAEVQRVRAIVGGSAASPADALVAALGRLAVHHGSVGLDESRLDHFTWQRLVERLADVQLVPAAGHLAEARRVKGPYEIECLGRALQLAEEALDVVVQALARGMTEREAVILYSTEVVKRGASPHRALVAGGERTWIAAPWPTDRALRMGDLIRLDVGCTYKGYCGSVARMAVLGEPVPSSETVCLALRTGLEAASAAVAPGVTAGPVLEAAVEAARSDGLPGYAADHVGYGIGLEPVERPTLAAGGVSRIEAGEVLCVETAYHEIGALGLCLRNTLLVTSAGARALNRSRHDLIVLD